MTVGNLPSHNYQILFNIANSINLSMLKEVFVLLGFSTKRSKDTRFFSKDFLFMFGVCRVIFKRINFLVLLSLGPQSIICIPT